MRVVAFAPSLRAVLDDAGGVKADGFPMTSAHVTNFPAQITVPLVLAVYTQGGTDYDPRRYIVARSPNGERLSVLECSWHWPDNPGVPVKFRVFAHHLPMVVQSPGVYSVGLYDSPDAPETDHLFPLPVVKVNPFAPLHRNPPLACSRRTNGLQRRQPANESGKRSSVGWDREVRAHLDVFDVR
jgi:hypothetical protein